MKFGLLSCGLNRPSASWGFGLVSYGLNKPRSSVGRILVDVLLVENAFGHVFYGLNKASVECRMNFGLVSY